MQDHQETFISLNHSTGVPYYPIGFCSRTSFSLLCALAHRLHPARLQHPLHSRQGGREEGRGACRTPPPAFTQMLLPVEVPGRSGWGWRREGGGYKDQLHQDTEICPLMGSNIKRWLYQGLRYKTKLQSATQPL